MISARVPVSVPPRPSLRAPQGTGGLILIVEDDVTTATILRQLLETDGFEVTVVNDGVEALLAIDHRKPDAIVTDVCMPGGDGRSLLRVMKQRCPEVPVIVMSAEDQSPTDFLREGAHAFLTKPFHIDDAVSIIDAALQLASTPR